MRGHARLTQLLVRSVGIDAFWCCLKPGPLGRLTVRLVSARFPYAGESHMVSGLRRHAKSKRDLMG